MVGSALCDVILVCCLFFINECPKQNSLGHKMNSRLCLNKCLQHKLTKTREFKVEAEFFHFCFNYSMTSIIIQFPSFCNISFDQNSPNV